MLAVFWEKLSWNKCFIYIDTGRKMNSCAVSEDVMDELCVEEEGIRVTPPRQTKRKRTEIAGGERN